jgi:hypothetical protein
MPRESDSNRGNDVTLSAFADTAAKGCAAARTPARPQPGSIQPGLSFRRSTALHRPMPENPVRD